MKYALFIIATLSMFLCRAQDRVQITGTIVNAVQEPQEGITVFNNNSLEGTITNDKGVFLIDARLNDNLVFKAIQFDSFVLTVGEKTIESRTATLTLSEGVNALDEVTLTDKGIMVPVTRTEIVDPKIDEVSLENLETKAIDRVENTFSDLERDGDDYNIRNEAFNQSQPRFNMVNLVGALAGLLINGLLPSDRNATIDLKRQAEREKFDVTLLKNKYNTDYLVEYLDIKEENLYEFMYFAKDNGLDNSYFTPERELDLLQFLSQTAEKYKERKRK